MAFARDLPFGRCVGVALPAAADSLHPLEVAFAQTLAPARRPTWIGGRVALRAALADLGVAAADPILATARGAPLLPAGAAGSVSHKQTVAVALAARADGATVGIDVELADGPRRDISSHILTDDERAALAALDPAARRAHVLTAFCAKEALYKALDPWVGRYVAFREVAIARSAGGALAATLRLSRGEGPFLAELHQESMDGLILVAARVRPLKPRGP